MAEQIISLNVHFFAQGIVGVSVAKTRASVVVGDSRSPGKPGPARKGGMRPN